LAAPLAGTVDRGRDDLAGLLYTSGTTGPAKGAMITHGNLSSNARALLGAWAFEPGDVLIHGLPLFHVHGLYVALNTAFLNGSPLIWLPRFDAPALVGLLAQATLFMGVPTHYTRLLAEPGLDSRACRAMRLFVSGSAPLLPETHVAFRERTGHAILERYGMTETGMIASNPYRGDRRPGTVGFALPGIAVRIADADGREPPRGEPGVIEVKGPNVCRGYWRKPERTAEDFRGDGYFITGDVGVMDGEGRVAILGRTRDLIITGGLNVYPREVEAALDALPGVVESAVVGVPHPDFGEGVVAAVVAGEGPVDEAAIIAALAESLAGFKLPKRVFRVADLPRNAMGKVEKAKLRERFADTFR
ncbi:MAG TPA: AMP-binding protein, partial [Aestuariivirgaceae bacterium]|nr:AMP-binding protein [Aestuariivirgaceae bacterium]